MHKIFKITYLKIPKDAVLYEQNQKYSFIIFIYYSYIILLLIIIKMLSPSIKKTASSISVELWVLSKI